MKSFILSAIMSLIPLLASSQSYEALWKTEQQMEADGKPQSAYKTVQTILKKALAEGHKGQALSARLRSAALHQEWAPDSFFTDVAELEQLRQAETSAEARAVYASVLAEVYQDNRNRSQARNLALESDDMKEWTREQYADAALKNWQLSLADLPMLADARSKDWLPFVVQNNNSEYFHHDLLHILWQRLSQQRTVSWGPSRNYVNEMGAAVSAEYARRGNRQAQLLVELDLLEDPFGIDYGKKREKLLELKEKYADLPLCTEVYIQLLYTDATDEQKVAWAEEALRLYPRYERINEVKNILNNLRQPFVVWTGNEVYYPGKQYMWQLRTKNATALNLKVYRLGKDFREEQIHQSKASVSDFFRRNAQLVQEINHSIEARDPHVTFEDSIAWTAPEAGRYAIVYTATTAESESQRKSVTDHYQLFQVTSLKTINHFLTYSQLEVITVDAESGQPLAGSQVTLYAVDNRTSNRKKLGTQTSDNEGRSVFNDISRENRRRLVLEAVRGSDIFMPEETFWNGDPSTYDERTDIKLHLYTDRAIYRPGQTVHVGGIVYSQRHWDAQVAAGKEYELVLRDANWKDVTREVVKTDERGVLAADFTLPEGCLPGVYKIQTDNCNVSFRVEEYKRPTFEVTMDEAPALQWPQDSITLTGKAMGYNGVPIRDGRVMGQYQFTYPYRWWFHHEDSPLMPLDSVQTDEMGVFSVRIPLKDIPAEALQYGLLLRTNVEVLSAAGETREGSLHVPLCTTPLRLNITMNEQQDRDRLQVPVFELLTSTGKPTEGDIRCSIMPAGSKEPLLKDIAPKGLKDALLALPSGDYLLHADARSGADTASAEAPFYIFSMADKRLPRRAESWLYCPIDTFDAAHPARIQIGSSFEDVALFYTLVGTDGLIENRLIHLSNELQILEIPYLPDYGDGVTAHFAFVKGGKCYTMSQALKLTMPENKLQWEWTSFRDRLHPGDHETWTLRLTRPDGKPADANLMAAIYDASLDQLTPHIWHLAVNRSHRLTYIPWRSRDIFREGSAMQHLFFEMKMRDVKGLSFDAFDYKWMNGLGFGRYMIGYGGGRMLKSTQARGMVREEMAMAEAPVMMAAAPKAANQSVQFDMADAEEAKAVDASVTSGYDEGEGGQVSAATPALRTNFNETAAFMPRLATNPKTGEVTLSFTLPESLTTWQMLGIAHTSDMLTADIQAQAIARKEMMARLFMPRFLRAGDHGSLRASVQNLTDNELSGTASLEVFDPETDKLILKAEKAFTAKAQGEDVLAFDFTPTEDYPVVAVRLMAETKPVGKKKKAVTFSDGEQHYLPILPSKTYMTESVEIRADSLGTFTTDLSSLFNHNSPTATNRRLTIEYTAHPIWYALQALPSLAEPQHDDVVSLGTALQAQALSTYIANNTPRLKTLVEIWKREAAQGQPALSSRLAEDEELKQIILDETPWLREAESEADRKARLIELFDISRQENVLTSTADRLEKRLQPDGGFAWFPGMESSEVMTRVVASELTRLRVMTKDFSSLPTSVKTSVKQILTKNVGFIASRMAERIKELKKAEAKGVKVSTASLAYLAYVYTTQHADVRLTARQQQDVTYILDHMKGSVASMDNWERAMAAVVMQHAGRKAEARQYYESLLEHATTTADHGTFFDYAGGSFEPTSHKIIHHVAAMEAVNVMEPQNKNLQRGLRRWLLQQKRTQMWESNICTADAIYALLTGNTAELQATAPDDIKLNYAKRQVDITRQEADNTIAGLGFIKKQFTDGDAPKTITVTRHTDSEAWGAVFATFLTPLSDASASSTGLKVRREVSSASLKVGDKLTTRYVITADRDYQYVCLRAARAACAEPSEMTSSYRYQGGLGYYMAVRDAHTDYFFDRMPKGTYVIEETCFIDRDGAYTSGLVTLRCLYAPEFGASTPATELTVGKE